MSCDCELSSSLWKSWDENFAIRAPDGVLGWVDAFLANLQSDPPKWRLLNCSQHPNPGAITDGRDPSSHPAAAAQIVPKVEGNERRKRESERPRRTEGKREREGEKEWEKEWELGGKASGEVNWPVPLPRGTGNPAGRFFRPLCPAIFTLSLQTSSF